MTLVGFKVKKDGPTVHTMPSMLLDSRSLLTMRATLDTKVAPASERHLLLQRMLIQILTIMIGQFEDGQVITLVPSQWILNSKICPDLEEMVLM